MDVSVLAAPVYIGSMYWEHHKLKERAAELGPTASDYMREDTRASLLLGSASLIVPITQYLGSHVIPGRGRYAKVMMAAVATAAGVTTAADMIVRRVGRSSNPSARSVRVSERAAEVARVGGVVAVAGGGIVLTAFAGHLGSVKRHWDSGKHRDLGTGWLPWTIAMVGWDVAFYWNHRLQHEIRAMWAIHVVHHSSERFNLSTALRQPVASAFGVWVPYGAMARVGVRPSLIEYSRGINLIYQFFIHTELIQTIGKGEEVLNTPSHHRVHHASNGRYLDRNYGGILVIWDRLFRSFQRELHHEDPVVYGLTRNIGTHKLGRVMTHEYHEMFEDIAASTNWRDRLSFVVRKPGWAYSRRYARLDQVNPGAV